MNDEARLQHARDSVGTTMSIIEAMYRRVGELAALADTAARRAADAEKRLDGCEQRYAEAAELAGRTSTLEAACEKLIDALDRLPLRMEDAGVIQTNVTPAIPLYGTHDWVAVEHAKLGLKQAMRKETT